MSLPRYPVYKPAETEWLHEVPSHWDVQPCRSIVTECVDKNEDAKNQDYLSLMANVGVIPYEEKGDVGNKKPEDLSKCKLVFKGDLVINSMNYGIGSYGLSALSGVCSPVYIVLRPKLERVKARFAFRIFENRAFQSYAQSFGNGILDHRAAINWDILKGIGVGLPPVDEQEEILCFLDRETAKIDALIADQEKLLALLSEKRQAVVMRAVTRGIDYREPITDSQVPWMGAVPAHWDLVALSKVTLERCDGPFGSGIKSDHYTDAGALVVRLQNIRAGNFHKGESVFLDETYFLTELQRHAVVEGDLLVAGLGDENNLLGRACVAPPGLGSALVKADCFRFRLDPEAAIPEFVAWQLSAGASFDAGMLSTGTTRSRIPLSVMASRKIALPPLEEQKEIVDFIASQNAMFDSVKAEAESAISLLRERRAALISAAVTGKIDVRGLVGPKVVA